MKHYTLFALDSRSDQGQMSRNSHASLAYSTFSTLIYHYSMYIMKNECGFMERPQSFIVRHKNVEYHSIEDVFAFFERGYIVHYKTK